MIVASSNFGQTGPHEGLMPQGVEGLHLLSWALGFRVLGLRVLGFRVLGFRVICPISGLGWGRFMDGRVKDSLPG